VISAYSRSSLFCFVIVCFFNLLYLLYSGESSVVVFLGDLFVYLAINGFGESVDDSLDS
jgi:hypothetical protein